MARLYANENFPLRKGVRGKYAKRYAEGSNVVVLAPDVAKFFPDSESVNLALRALVDVAKSSVSLDGTGNIPIMKVRALVDVAKSSVRNAGA